MPVLPSRLRRTLLASFGRAHPPGTQPGPRRRIHVLGSDHGPGRHTRFRLRAGARRHPDAQSMGPRRPAGGDGALAGRVPVRAGGLRVASARREHRLGLRTRARWTRADIARRRAPPRGGDPRRHDDGVPRPPPRPRRVPPSRAAFRADPSGGGVGPGRCRAADPRRPAHVLRHRPRQAPRPRRVVVAGDRSASAARRQRRPPRHRCRTPARPLTRAP